MAFLPPVWPPPVSLATTPGISFDFSSSPYLDVSVREVPLLNLWIQLRICGSSPQGFPHSDIRGSMLISNSPRLFAGYRVLLRLSVPRHSPYALFRLNSSSFLLLLFSLLCFYCLSFANSFFGLQIKRPFLVLIHCCVRRSPFALASGSRLTKLFPLFPTEKPSLSLRSASPVPRSRSRRSL